MGVDTHFIVRIKDMSDHSDVAMRLAQTDDNVVRLSDGGLVFWSGIRFSDIENAEEAERAGFLPSSILGLAEYLEERVLALPDTWEPRKDDSYTKLSTEGGVLLISLSASHLITPGEVDALQIKAMTEIMKWIQNHPTKSSPLAHAIFKGDYQSIVKICDHIPALKKYSSIFESGKRKQS
jgi:hypothetical protein